MAVNKEMWLDVVYEQFREDSQFMAKARDLSAFVENNTLHLGEAGADPTVLVNNTTYPIAVAPRADTDIAVPLDTLDTENTVVRNIEKMETAYDKVASVTRGHAGALRTACLDRAAHAWAPGSDSANTPIVLTTGGDNGSSRKRMKLADLAKMQKRMDLAQFPKDRILVLHPDHVEDLLVEDSSLTKAFADIRTGVPLTIYGFTIFVFSATAIYNGSNVKKAFGAAAAGTDRNSSLVYCAGEVFWADGTMEMFVVYNDPKERGDIFGFQKRFLALPVRNKAIGAIVSDAV